MVKQRMASADVAGEVSCLKSKLLGLRLANIYDLSPKACAPHLLQAQYQRVAGQHAHYA